jgi:hypothetical protein
MPVWQGPVPVGVDLGESQKNCNFLGTRPGLPCLPVPVGAQSATADRGESQRRTPIPPRQTERCDGPPPLRA